MTGLLQRISREERGAVWVFVALGMPLLLLFAAFAIDVGHWYDWKRNLQTRADAAALAGGGVYGNTCLSSTPSAVGLDQIGKTAQQYSGAGVGATVPYTLAAPYTPTQNQPNLTASGPGNFTLLVNSAAYANQSGSNFSMTPTGNYCDATDENGRRGAMLDVRLTQRNIPLFFNKPFSILPAINAHARVGIQGVQSEGGIRPIAVRDAGVTPCATAIFIDDSTGATLATARLTNTGGSPATWTNATTPVAVPMPSSGHHVSVQSYLYDCSTTSPDGDIYTPGAGGGLTFINNYATATAPSGGAPVITTGGVLLTGGTLGGACDPYFFTSTGGGGSCTIGVQANVSFQPGLTLAKAHVYATDDTTGTRIALQAPASGTLWRTAAATGFSVAANSGAHPIRITWEQDPISSVGGTACTNGGNNPCKGDFGVKQRTVAGTNGTNTCADPPLDTGPVLNSVIAEPTASPPVTAGADAFAAGSTHNLVVSLSIAGLANSGASDPPICLRVDVSTDKATGIIDCGQGNGTSAIQDTITNGCPDPLQKNTRLNADGSLSCSPAITPADCVALVRGTRGPVLLGFTNRINCSDNNWGTSTPVTLADPRAFIMVVTSPADLSGNGNAANVPIRTFAVFYVTGWGTRGSAPNCAKNEAYPGSGGANGNEAKAKVWGHWTSLTVPSGTGTGNGSGCNFNQFGNCIAVLTN